MVDQTHTSADHLPTVADKAVAGDPQHGFGSVAVGLSSVALLRHREQELKAVVDVARGNGVAVLYTPTYKVARVFEESQVFWNRLLVQGPSNLVAWTLRELASVNAGERDKK